MNIKKITKGAFLNALKNRIMLVKASVFPITT